jgi:hypothetical protein
MQKGIFDAITGAARKADADARQAIETLLEEVLQMLRSANTEELPLRKLKSIVRQTKKGITNCVS